MDADLCGVKGARNEDADATDVRTLLRYGCRDAAASRIESNMKAHIRAEVAALAFEWARGNRGQFSNAFDNMARAILAERIKADEIEQARREAVGLSDQPTKQDQQTAAVAGRVDVREADRRREPTAMRT